MPLIFKKVPFTNSGHFGGVFFPIYPTINLSSKVKMYLLVSLLLLYSIHKSFTELLFHHPTLTKTLHAFLVSYEFEKELKLTKNYQKINILFKEIQEWMYRCTDKNQAEERRS